ncbi:hypothetical protein [Burkholderia pseudomallei]|uniref:hypothetical protein n=1 Tax=Burkholderia pseudomallei TaxID=28450 RepID=UPI0021F74E90|nr:hypothetical protein [Burkholderia pseudomallei]MCW0022764.1 hypothetical protein [Burkholderia pseudomallei]MCW0168387.1 hypothetical protein [Burkholderia pseudomallei]
MKHPHSVRHPSAFHCAPEILTNEHDSRIVRFRVSAIENETKFARVAVLNFIKERLLNRRRSQNRRLGGIGRIVCRKAAWDAIDREYEIVSAMPQLEPIVLAREGDGPESILLPAKPSASSRVSVIELTLKICLSCEMLRYQNVRDDAEAVRVEGRMKDFRKRQIHWRRTLKMCKFTKTSTAIFVQNSKFVN